MLVLNRRIGESVMISDDITIKIVGIQPNNQVRLGIEAPKKISVHRREIYEKIKAALARNLTESES